MAENSGLLSRQMVVLYTAIALITGGTGVGVKMSSSDEVNAVEERVRELEKEQGAIRKELEYISRDVKENKLNGKEILQLLREHMKDN